MCTRQKVVIGFLGTRLDTSTGPHRWLEWRPTVSLGQQEDWVPDRVELLYDAAFSEAAQLVMRDLRQCAPQCHVRGHANAKKLDHWDFASMYAHLHDFATSYAFAPEKEDYYIHITTGTHVAQICLFLLTESGHLPGKLLQTSPPKQLRRGPDLGSLVTIDLDLSKYDALKTRFAEEVAATHNQLKSGIPTKNIAYNRLIEDLTTVATVAKDPILLTGPTGAGKSMLAKRIYDLRQHKASLTGKFVEVNCATLRGDAAMSTLFGHVKGAFTGAAADRQGLLREADAGLLFLDEVGELGLDEQALLLRALEDKAFYPYGGDKLVRSDFQLVCGTNRDLESAVQQGRFREDLLARLNLWTFAIPGLAERKEDIAPNVDYELEKFATTTGKKVTFNKESRDAFLSFARHPDAKWRGNFRDLSAAIIRLATLAPRGRISLEQVEAEAARLQERWRKLSLPNTEESNGHLDLEQFLSTEELAKIDLLDQVQLATVIRICRQSKSMAEAGRKLYAVSRLERTAPNDSDRVRKFLARFGLDWEKVSSC